MVQRYEQKLKTSNYTRKFRKYTTKYEDIVSNNVFYNGAYRTTFI